MFAGTYIPHHTKIDTYFTNDNSYALAGKFSTHTHTHMHKYSDTLENILKLPK